MAHLDPARNRTAVSSSSTPAAPSYTWQPGTLSGRALEEDSQRKDELAKELVVIESNIRDRERELSINHKMQAAFSSVASTNAQGTVTYSIVGSSAVGSAGAGGHGIVTTAVSGLRAGTANTNVA